MSKKARERKAQQRAVAEARRITPGKLFRLFLKSLVFALVVGFVITLATAYGIPGFDSFWVQIAVMIAIYLVAYPFLMSEFRPKREDRHKR